MAETESRDHGTARNPGVRRRILNGSNLLVILVTIAAAAFGLWWLYDRLTHVYVQDARISADMLLLSSHVSGWVSEVPVGESQRVDHGDLLVRVDDRIARSRLAELDAGVALLDAGIETLAARIELGELRARSGSDAALARLDVAESALTAASGDLEVAEADWRRASSLQQRNLISQQEWDDIHNRYRNAVQTHRQRQAEIATARADLAAAETLRQEVLVLRSELTEAQQRREQALAQQQQARATLDDHRIRAPVAGVIDELFIDPGEHVSPGQRVLLMHDPDRIWVSANVKETDLRHLQPGDRVRISVDAYPDETRGGVIRRIGSSATSQFALLPNANPSGNFTKITQRVETRIDLDEPDPRLKPGMMVEIRIPRGS